MTTRNEVHVAAIEAFLLTPTGRLLVDRIEDEIRDSFDEFKKADPEDAKAIRSAQNRAWRAETFKDWLLDLLASDAAEQLEDELSEDN